MYYCYILLSLKSHIFYFGSTNDLRSRLKLHNNGEVKSTKPHIPWELVWYGVFTTEKEAKDFERYLKTGSGKAFAYKRLVSVFSDELVCSLRPPSGRGKTQTL